MAIWMGLCIIFVINYLDFMITINRVFVITTNMITNNKKRGRPASGVEKKFFAKRLTEDQRKLVDQVLGEFNGRDYVRAVKEPEEVAKDIVDDFRKQVKVLLDDAERAAKEIEQLKLEAEQAAMMSDEDKVIYWRSRCLACEGRKEGEFDQSV